MKIICSRNDLLRGIQIIQGSLATRTTLPVLSNFLLEVENEKIKLTSTDLEVCTKCEISGNIKSIGSITIPAKRFGDIIKNLPENKDVEITLQENFIIEIRCGKSFFSLSGIGKEEFPLLPEFPEENVFSFNLLDFREMLKLTSFAVSTEEARYVLNGILFTVADGKFNLVATDGRRLANIVKNGLAKSINLNAIVAIKGVNEVSRIASIEEGDEIKISFTKSQVFFKINDVVIMSRLIEGTFPDYKKYIPKKFDMEAVLNTQEFISAVKQSSLMIQERFGTFGPVKFNFSENFLKITSSTQGIGTAVIEMDIEYKGPNLEIAFNPYYIIDFLKNIDTEKVIFKMTGPLTAALLQPLGEENYIYVIMPLRIE